MNRGRKTVNGAYWYQYAPFLISIRSTKGCAQHTTSEQYTEVLPYPFNIMEFVNLILSGSKQTPHSVSLHDTPALYKKHSFLRSKEVYQV